MSPKCSNRRMNTLTDARRVRAALIDALCAPVADDESAVIRRVLIADRHARAIARELTKLSPPRRAAA